MLFTRFILRSFCVITFFAGTFAYSKVEIECSGVTTSPDSYGHFHDLRLTSNPPKGAGEIPADTSFVLMLDNQDSQFTSKFVKTEKTTDGILLVSANLYSEGVIGDGRQQLIIPDDQQKYSIFSNIIENKIYQISTKLKCTYALK
jgi:hypothetical protein